MQRTRSRQTDEMVRVALITRGNLFNATYESKENKTSVPQMECNKLHKLKIVGSFYCTVVFVLFSLLSLRLFPVAGSYHRGDEHTEHIFYSHGPFPRSFLFAVLHPSVISIGWRSDEAVAGESRMELHHPAAVKVSVCTSRAHPPGTTVSTLSVDWGLLSFMYALWQRINTLVTQTGTPTLSRYSSKCLFPTGKCVYL